MYFNLAKKDVPLHIFINKKKIVFSLFFICSTKISKHNIVFFEWISIYFLKHKQLRTGIVAEALTLCNHQSPNYSASHAVTCTLARLQFQLLEMLVIARHSSLTAFSNRAVYNLAV